MNILITGGLGFIGSNLVSILKILGYNVITLDLKDGADYQLDISKDDLTQIKENIDVIYHLAAQPFGKGSELDPILDVDCNVKGTLNVCYLAKYKNIKHLIYTSTMAVYGNNEFASENDILDPLSNYAVSKLSGEFYVKKFSKETNFKYTILRLWNTYGPGQDISNEYKGIVSAFTTQILKGNYIKVTGSLDRFRDIIYIEDVIKALIHSLSLIYSDTYNVSTGKKTTVKELIENIILVCNKNINDFIIDNTGGHNGDQQGCVGNNNKLINTGWQPEIKLEQGLKQFINYINKNEYIISK